VEMKLTPANLLQHELIGLEVEVERSTNKSMEGIRGRVVDETMKMLVIEDEKRRLKKLPKAGNVFVFSFKSEGKRIKVRVNGDILVARPEDRIKKLAGVGVKRFQHSQ